VAHRDAILDLLSAAPVSRLDMIGRYDARTGDGRRANAVICSQPVSAGLAFPPGQKAGAVLRASVMVG
jgi:hypothetical protein